MPQIQPISTYEHLLYTTVRLEIGLANGTSVGTGFFYDHYAQDGRKIPLLVTNKHVVKGCQSIKIRFHQRDSAAPRWVVKGYVDLAFPLTESNWTGHPNPDIDLSAIRLSIFQQQAAKQGKEIAIFTVG